MRILPIVAHLKAHCPSLGGRVEVARSLTALDEKDITDLPCVFVHSGKEKAGSNSLMNGVSQQKQESFVLLIVAKVSDDIDEPIEDIREEIEAALLNLSFDHWTGPVIFAEGDVMDIRGRMCWWADMYTAEKLIRNITNY